MCAAADSVLLATTDDFDDPTHFNVQPQFIGETVCQIWFCSDITRRGLLNSLRFLFRKSKTSLCRNTTVIRRKKLQDYNFALQSSDKHFKE